jgi:hypothetical protein
MAGLLRGPGKLRFTCVQFFGQFLLAEAMTDRFEVPTALA